jgi:uncharacterized BrkB/YihY/UPF0761 family membrane protein
MRRSTETTGLTKVARRSTSVIAQSPVKPIRVWMHVSQNDNGATAGSSGLHNWVIANIRFWLPDQIIPLGYGISLLLTILLDVALYMAIYILLPHGASTWREILPGAIGAGILWEFAKKTFLSFVSTYITITNLVYGTLATIIAFLLWAYISSLIFIFGAYLNLSYWQLNQSKL